MILSITPNTTLDHTLIIPTLEPNRTIRALESHTSMGGKPTDASWILGELGYRSLALGFAAGVTGQRVEELLMMRGVMTDFTPVGGETRINTVILDQQAGTHTTITTSTLEVEPVHVTVLRERYTAALNGATCVVLGGTLPNGTDPALYAEFITMARERGVPTVFDAAEPNLSAGLAASPTFIKPNRDELAGLIGRPVETFEDAYPAALAILEQHNTASVITFGAQGALAVLPDCSYRIPALNIPVVSPAGAGDAVLAGLAYSLSRREPLEDGLRLGFAAAAAVCLLPGTADCRRADVEAFMPQIELLPFPG